MLLLRSAVSSVVFFALMGRKLYFYMWESIPSRYRGDLASRVCQGLVLMVASFTSIKTFPLVYVSLVSNMTPLLTAVASYFLFKVGLSRLDTAILLISFGGVTLLITGAPSKQVEELDVKTAEEEA
jgi:drug/metabolite transporter (DMT)-like permease